MTKCWNHHRECSHWLPWAYPARANPFPSRICSPPTSGLQSSSTRSPRPADSSPRAFRTPLRASIRRGAGARAGTCNSHRRGTASWLAALAVESEAGSSGCISGGTATSAHWIGCYRRTVEARLSSAAAAAPPCLHPPNR